MLKRSFRTYKKILSVLLFLNLLVQGVALPVVYAEETAPVESAPAESTPSPASDTGSESAPTTENSSGTAPEEPAPANEPAETSAVPTEEGASNDATPGEPEEPTEPEEPIEPEEEEPAEPEEPTEPDEAPEPIENSTPSSLESGENSSGLPEAISENSTGPQAGTTTNATTSTVTLPTLTAELSASTTPGTAESATTTLAEPDTLIETGSALASGSLVNVANTNTVGSGGAILVMNQGATDGTIDTRNALGSGAITGSGCDCGGLLSTSIEGEIERKLLIDGLNTATITNDLTVAALTGENAIASSSDNASIVTGDAYAAGNIINIVNSNFVGVDYLIFLLNNLGNLVGDIILPGQSFFSNLLAGLASFSGNMSVSNENTGQVTNVITADAETGENTVASGTPSLITTGDVENYANVTNVVNKNIFGNFLYIFLRVTGDWNGEIFGLPDGIDYARVNGGILFYAEPEEPEGNHMLGNLEIESETEIANQNFAHIVNNLNLNALTGQNSITGADSAAIETGDAKTVANIVNIANTNIVGDHWLMAMINILGDWNGNLSFGQPDLVVTERVTSAGSPPSYDEPVRFTLDVGNAGDATATEVVLRWRYNQPGVISGFTLPDGARERDGSIWWEVGTLAPGEHRTFEFDGRVISRPTTEGRAIAEVRGRETDANTGNNFDVVVFAYQSPTGGQGTANNTNGNSAESSSHTTLNIPSPTGALNQNSSGAIAMASSGTNTGSQTGNEQDRGQGAPTLSITKNHDALTTKMVPGRVKFSIVISNTGTGSAYDTVVEDIMTDPNGTVIARQTWPIGIIYPNEDIVLDYDMEFTGEAISGIYTNKANLQGVDENRAALPALTGTATLSLSNPSKSREVRSNAHATSTAITTITGGGTLARSEANQSPLSGSILGETTANRDGAWREGDAPKTVFADSPEYTLQTRDMSRVAASILAIALPLFLFLALKKMLSRRKEDLGLHQEEWRH